MIVSILQNLKDVLEKLIKIALVLNERAYTKTAEKETDASAELVGACNSADARQARIVQQATQATVIAKTKAAERYEKVSVKLENKISKLNEQRMQLEDM